MTHHLGILGYFGSLMWVTGTVIFPGSGLAPLLEITILLLGMNIVCSHFFSSPPKFSVWDNASGFIPRLGGKCNTIPAVNGLCPCLVTVNGAALTSCSDIL